jgi:NADH:ubiquinone oxidoreductase subunit 4 (subunit M)
LILRVVFFGGKYYVYDIGADIFEFLPPYVVGIDNLSSSFMILTSFLIPTCILIGWDIKYRYKEYIYLLFFLEYLLFNVFSNVDLIYFYIFYELVLIPMLLIIGVWGSRERKIHANYKFFLYTFVGSLFMIVAIIYIYLQLGTTNLLNYYKVRILEGVN